jgi:hypothetical protein
MPSVVLRMWQFVLLGAVVSVLGCAGQPSSAVMQSRAEQYTAPPARSLPIPYGPIFINRSGENIDVAASWNRGKGAAIAAAHCDIENLLPLYVGNAPYKPANHPEIVTSSRYQCVPAGTPGAIGLAEIRASAEGRSAFEAEATRLKRTATTGAAPSRNPIRNTAPRPNSEMQAGSTAPKADEEAAAFNRWSKCAAEFGATYADLSGERADVIAVAALGSCINQENEYLALAQRRLGRAPRNEMRQMIAEQIVASVMERRLLRQMSPKGDPMPPPQPRT